MASQIRVLVVDDDEPHAEAVAESLQRVGYDCVVAGSAIGNNVEAWANHFGPAPVPPPARPIDEGAHLGSTPAPLALTLAPELPPPPPL